MYYRSKKVSLVTLGITALVCTRSVFSFFNDPEGPNLLIVFGMTAIVYVLSVPLYVSNTFVSLKGLPRLLGAMLIQILIVTAFYFLGR